MAILDAFAVERGNKVNRMTMLSSLIYKIDIVKMNGNKLHEGDKALYINERYNQFTAIIKKIIRERQSLRRFCKIFDVLVDVRGKDEECTCIYFGYSGKVCLKKHVKYELFDEMFNDDEIKEESIDPSFDEGRSKNHQGKNGDL